MILPVLFFPGWGFDIRVGDLLPCLRGRQVLPLPGFSHPAMLTQAAQIVSSLCASKHDVPGPKVDVLGWSMGANLACDFVDRFSDQVATLTLLAGRHQWPDGEINEIIRAVRADKADFMTKFYRKCFLGNKKIWQSFQEVLLADYLAAGQIDFLLAGLAYLADFTMPELAADLPVKIIHGKKDVIAPWPERLALSGVMAETLANDGHFPSNLERL